MATPSSNAPARSFVEIALGFLGAALVVPLLFRVVFAVVPLLFRATFGVVFGAFRLLGGPKLLAEAAVVGAATLLTRDDVLDKVFSRNDEADGASTDTRS